MKKSKRKPQLLLSSVFAWSLAAAILAWADQDPVSAGKRAFDEGKYTEAIRLLQAVPAGANACEVHFITGLARYRLRQLDQALIDLQSAAECDPKSAELRVALAEAYLQKGNDNKALLALQSALNIQPDNKTALSDASAVYLRHEMNAEAVATLEKLVAVEPKNAQARTDLGAAYAGALNFEKARTNFEQALGIDPRNASALIGLGHAELKAEHPSEAIKLFGRAIQAAPHAFEPRYLRGLAFSGIGQNREAIADLEAAIQLGGRDPEIYYRLAQVNRALGRKEEAQRALEQFAALRSQSNKDEESRREAARLTTEAKAMVEEGKLSDAIGLLEKSLALEGDAPQTLFRLASLYYDTQQYDRAGRDDRKAIGLDASEWSYHYLLGLIERKKGNANEARISFETAVRLNPSAAEVFNQLGELSAAQSDYEGAGRRFEQAARLDPREPAYQANLQKARTLTRQ